MTWELLPEFQGTVYHGCLHCGGTFRLASLEMWISYPDDDYTVVTCDGMPVNFFTCHSEIARHFLSLDVTEEGEEDALTLAYFEAIALLNPDHDWQVQLLSPLRDACWQRQAPGTWVLVDSGMGYA